MTVDFAKGVVSPGLCTCTNIRSIRSKTSMLASNVFAVASSIVRPALATIASTFLRALISLHPPLSKDVPFGIIMADRIQHLIYTTSHGTFPYSGLDAPKAKDFPSAVDDITEGKFFKCIPRPRRNHDASCDLGVVGFSLPSAAAQGP
jgi:hypothetical protein